MKKVNKILFSLLLIFIISLIPNVKALKLPEYNMIDSEPGFLIDDEFKISDYNGSYIIGSHIFTAEGNDKYDGILRTEHIMYASLTIGKNQLITYIPTLDDMKAYYVDVDKIVDAYTGEEIKDFSAFIKYVNLEKLTDKRINDEIEKPVLTYVDYTNDTKDTEFFYADAMLAFSIKSKDQPDFYQLAVSDAEDGSYVIMSQKEAIEYGDYDYYYLGASYATNQYVKARGCDVKGDDYECSDWSNIEKTYVLPPEPFYFADEETNENGQKEIEFIFNNIENIDGFEILTTTTDDKKFDAKISQDFKKQNQYIVIIGPSSEMNYEEYTEEEFINNNFAKDYEECKDNEYDNCYIKYTMVTNNVQKLTIEKDQYKYAKVRYYVYDSNSKKVYGNFAGTELFYNPVTVVDETPKLSMVNEILNVTFDNPEIDPKYYEIYEINLASDFAYYPDLYTKKELSETTYFSYSEALYVRGIIFDKGVAKYTKFSDILYGNDVYFYDVENVDEFSPAKIVKIYDTNNNIVEVKDIYDVNDEKLTYKKVDNYFVMNNTLISRIYAIELNNGKYVNVYRKVK